MSNCDSDSDWSCDEEIEDEPCKCLICDFAAPFPRLEEHLEEVHGGSIVKRCKDLKLDLVGFIRFVNFCRIRAAKLDPADAKTMPMDTFLGAEKDTALLLKEIADDKFLIPAIPNDALLSAQVPLNEDGLSSDDESKDGTGACESHPKGECHGVPQDQMEIEHDTKSELERLRKKVLELEHAHNEYVAEVRKRLYGDVLDGNDADDATVRSKNESGSESESESEDEFKGDQDGYFLSYSGLGIHDDMLKDLSRTGAYFKYITENPQVFKDKVVMDVGAGTGVLSMFAVKAGAKKVYAVEASGIARVAERNIKQNGMSDKIELLKGRVEYITLPSDVKVDCIVSEWMGYFLVFENMLESVLFARDKWLRKETKEHPAGVMAPSRANIFLYPLDCEEKYNDLTKYYDNVFGLNMKPTLEAILNDAIVTCVSPEQVLPCEPPRAVLKEMDLGTIKKEELKSIKSGFAFVAQRDGTLHGFAGCFDTIFDGATTVRLGTTPSDTPTHWSQTVMYLDTPLAVKRGTTIEGSISVDQLRADDRCLSIVLSFALSTDAANVVTKRYTLQ